MTTTIEVRDLVQEYPGVRALKGVSLSVEAGQVLGLVGENGAGKSTLIRMLGGLEAPVSGEIKLRGVAQHFRGAAQSQAAGISIVSQEFRLVPQLSVADNIFLGHELAQGGVVQRRSTYRRAQELLTTLGLDLDPGRPVGSLTVGDQQMVEIARALSRDFDLIVMDEPTAALSTAETARLHQIVRRLADQGKAVIYVTHHLDEIFAICDVVVVLRDGSMVARAQTDELDEPLLVEHMLGRKPQVFDTVSATTGDDEEGPSRLEVDAVVLAGMEEPFSLKVSAGEVLGLAGLVGSGRTELMRAIFGDLPVKSGTMRMDGRPIRVKDSRGAVRQGIFMLSDDRKAEGSLAHLDVTENAMISRDPASLHGLRKFVPSRKEERARFAELRRDMAIRTSDDHQLIGNLSGGNQQKVLLGRALLSGCKVLLLNEPTRGVDVGAKIEIYQLIRRLADNGVAVLVSSSDAPELVAIAQRTLVYFAGHQTADLRGRDITEENIVAASVGQQIEGAARA